MRKLVLFLLGLTLLFLTPQKVSAHPGNTASDGCHYCWTNCASWGEVYGERHCHGGGSIYTPPIYTPPPSCPLFSSYDSLSDSCKCNYGYVASGGRCISQDQYCTDKYGYGSRFNILNDTCECSSSYVFDSSKQECVSGLSYCWNKYGYNSSYDSLSKSCECSYDYRFNTLGTECISNDDYCQDEFSYGSEYSILKDGCVCKDGYINSGNRCALDTSDDYDFETFTPTIRLPNSPVPTIRPTTKPTATPKVQNNTPKPTPSITSTPTPSPSATTEIQEENQEVSSAKKKESVPLWRRIIRFIFGF